jgi:hypothetical protein
MTMPLAKSHSFEANSPIDAPCFSKKNETNDFLEHFFETLFLVGKAAYTGDVIDERKSRNHASDQDVDTRMEILVESIVDFNTSAHGSTDHYPCRFDRI